ncbi:response regulator transcription factor [Geomesophilobacter sediminis]|nr:response regulator transcription factor [Geomesophilobacter sediminis]
MSRILIIDDDTGLCELLGDYLGSEGFQVRVVHNGEDGALLAVEREFDFVVLDVMLPGINGFEVLARIRRSSMVPVLMLTARGEEIDRIVGLEMGADDYLPKPFNPRELVARLRAIQRRAQSAGPAESVPERLAAGDLVLDSGTRSARVAGAAVDITSLEFSILEVLLRMAGKVVSREDLMRQALGRSFSPFDRSVDVHVSNIRRKLGPLGDGGERIKSVRGVGYIYSHSAAEAKG